MNLENMNDLVILIIYTAQKDKDGKPINHVSGDF